MTKNERAKLRRQRKVRRFVLTIALMALVAVIAIGGTVAWLTVTTEPVVNTFTAGDINITLTETWNTDFNNDGTDDSWSAKLIPGKSYRKDPVVTVKEGSEDCYLFVKFEEKNNPSNYLTYISTLTPNNGWTQGDGTNIPTNVWYREVKASNATKSWHLLENDNITVNAETVTKDSMDTAIQARLTYTAYACQRDNITSAADAWAKLNTNT